MSFPEAAPLEVPDEQEARRLIGHVLSDRYRIDRVLGMGGMGAVYGAEHLLMHKRVAIKVLHPEMTRLSEVVQRFEREAMAAAHIEHPNVATAYDFGKLESGAFFLVLEFVEGKSLRDVLEADGPLPVERAVHITRQILQALSRAHSLGIVHRDLKPENVMLVERDEDPDFVKVLDFGIAKVPMGQLMEQSSEKKPVAALTQLGMVYGTPEYMAPEQALGQDVDHRADLYALGVMFFEMLMGIRPFNAPSPVQILGMVVSKPVPTMASILPAKPVPVEVEEVCRTLLAKVTTDRYSDARSAIQALDAAMAPALQPYARAPFSGPLMKPISAASVPVSAGLLDSVTLADRLKALPRELQMVIGGGVGFVVLVVLLAVVVKSARPPEATTLLPATSAAASAASGSAAVIEPAKPEISDEEFKAASAQGIEALSALAQKSPTEARVLSALGKAELGAKRFAAALGTFEKLLDADAEAGRDRAVQHAMAQLAQSDETAEKTFALLTSKMGESGPDVLYELMTTPKVSPKAQKQAKELLASPGVQEKRSAALKVAMDLRRASFQGAGELCRVHRDVFGAAREHGDNRSQVFLRPLTNPKGCGFLKRSDCHPCLRDGLLEKAISAISTRAKTAAAAELALARRGEVSGALPALSSTACGSGPGIKRDRASSIPGHTLRASKRL